MVHEYAYFFMNTFGKWSNTVAADRRCRPWQLAASVAELWRQILSFDIGGAWLQWRA